MKYQILFFTHSGAIKFRRKTKKLGVSCDLMPVPRVLSSNCSVSARIDFNGDIQDLIDSEIEKIFTVNDDFIEVYSAE
jgi:hypothetical protein